MTWKEFKERVESRGVTDNMYILYIDISQPFLYIDITEDGIMISDEYDN